MSDQIETRGHVTGFREEIEKAKAQGREEFLAWFDRSPGAAGAIVRGAWDFALHIARPLAPHLREPEKKIVLEIGYGGGRLLGPAARAFEKAIGVDVHTCGDLVREELARQGIHNIELHAGDGRTLPIPDEFVDVVCSFIVLHHVETLEIHKSLIAETWRVLRPGGVAILYHGRISRLSCDTSSRLRLALDRLLEATVFRGTCRANPARVNDVNLRLSEPLARSIARDAGFTCAGAFVSRKRVPDGYARYGTQLGLLLKKPL